MVPQTIPQRKSLRLKVPFFPKGHDYPNGQIPRRIDPLKSLPLRWQAPNPTIVNHPKYPQTFSFFVARRQIWDFAEGVHDAALSLIDHRLGLKPERFRVTGMKCLKHHWTCSLNTVDGWAIQRCVSVSECHRGFGDDVMASWYCGVLAW